MERLIDLWIRQAEQLSVAQSVFLLLLCCIIVGLMLAFYQMEDKDGV